MPPSYNALLQGLSRPERLRRALALSALVRSFVWAGAWRDVQDKGSDTVRDRFLLKLYGASAAAELSRTINKCSLDG